ncbi:MAG: reprolysin-like metallopeptidase [Ferruginibacter sp.]
MKKTLLLTLLFALVTTLGFSQTGKYWSVNSESRGNITTDRAVTRLTFPKVFKLFNLNIDPLRQELFSIVGNHASRHSTVISLPTADGGIEEFEVFEASNFEPALQAQFPEIRAYSGKGITDKYATLKLSISPRGIQTMVFRADKENEFIEAYSEDHTVYAAFKSHRTPGQLPWTCSTEDKKMASDLNAQISSTQKPESNTGELKTMRLAQSCNGEYSNYFGAFNATQVALVLAAYNATLTRCNGCYEKDLAIHLNLVPETVNVIYYVPATDPYTTLANWNTQLQIALNTTLTGTGTPLAANNAAYDIGHMFGASGGGGNAGCIGCVCVDGTAAGTGSTKGRGITSPADGIPMGDNFDIDYVVHEVGHQMGGNHTFSHNLEGSGQNKEVGSGITIMGYAGITGFDVAPHSIDIFHETTIAQIQANMAGKTCPITTNITAVNATPVIAPVSNYTIPISTPFALTGSATDANPGDVLTYCWEQNDNATTSGANSVASPTKATGPNWLSFSPSVNPTRTCPILSTILNGLFITPVLPGGDPGTNIEALSSVARTLNFRLTVRDNSPYSSTVPIKIGQTAFADVAVTVSAASGPFGVSSPNTAVSWVALSSQTVTWTVNNTTAPPVSCANVNILLSTDGGFTWPITLATNTANDGSELVTIPNNPGATNRVKVESVGNIFFDISNTNFTITPALSGFSFNATTAATIACNGPATANVLLGTTANGGFSTPINLSALSGVPAGASISFNVNPLAPGSSVIVTLNNANTLANGTYNVTIQGVAGTVTQTAVVTFIVSAGVGPVITGQPASITVCEGNPAVFTVTATGATVYQWHLNGVNVGTNSATYTIAAVTAGDNGSLIQVTLTGQCGVTTSVTAILTVNTAPVITTQPANATACAGSSATFTVAATGTGLSYQWQSSPVGCTGPWTDIPAATTNSYTLSGITLASDNTGYRCVVTGTCAPAVTSSCAVLTVGNAAAITTQPVDVTVCEGSNAVFTVATSGTINSYQWQENTGSGFVDMPGQTAATLTLNAVTVSMSGRQYRVNAFSCTAIPLTSNAVTLTVNTLISISVQPADVTVCLGANASFSVTATGTGIAYQWQYAASCAGTFTDIPAATNPTLNLNAVTLANAGAYRVVVTGTCNTVTSSCATLVVNSPVTISVQPANVDICLPLNTASFSVTAAGTGLTYQWQVNTGSGFTNIPTGGNAATLNLTGITAAMNGYLYRVVLNGTCTTDLNSASAILAVNSPVNITSQPQDVSSCAGSATSFSVAATGSTITYQWQVSINGGPFVNVNNTAPFSGATTATLNISPVSASLNGYVFHVIVSGVPCGAVTSDPVTLTANALPVVVLTAASYSSITPYIRTTLYTTVSPPIALPATYVYQWYRDGVLVPDRTADRFDVTVDDLGVYDVIVTDTTTGCSSKKSNTAKIDFAASGTLFIYPNPSSGQFQVRYLSYTSNVARTLNIYDSKGARVYQKEYPTAGPYTKMDVNMDNAASDVYLVELRDASGKRLATGKVVIK